MKKNRMRNTLQRILRTAVATIAVIALLWAALILVPLYNARQLSSEYQCVEIGMTRSELMSIMGSEPFEVNVKPNIERGRYDEFDNQDVVAIRFLAPVMLNSLIAEFVLSTNNVVIAKSIYD